MKTYATLEEAGIDSLSKKILLGKGSYGKVRSYLSNPNIAIKTFNKQLTIEDDRVMKELNFFHFAETHNLKWVPAYYGRVVEASGRVHLLMERCGVSLYSFLQRSNPTVQARLAITKQMIGIVYALGAHHSLCHLDLKTPNFLWDASRKHLTLVDWGFCLVPGMRQGALTVKGVYKPPLLTAKIQTRDYRAPEIYLAGSTLPRTFAVDLWSLGMCLLEIWNGPFVNLNSLSSDEEFPNSPIMLKQLLSTFGPMTVFDDIDDRSNEDGPFAGWKAYYDPSCTSTYKDSKDADHVFKGFLEWVRVNLLATHPDRRITHAQLAAHPVLGCLCASYKRKPWVKPYPKRADFPFPFKWWTTLTDWLWEVTVKCCQDLTAYFLGCYATYVYLGVKGHGITNTTFQALGAMCMYYVGLWCTPHLSPHSFDDWAYFTDHAYTPQELQHLFLELTDRLPPLADLWFHTPWYHATCHPDFEANRAPIANAMAQDLMHNDAHFLTCPHTVAGRIINDCCKEKKE